MNTVIMNQFLEISRRTMEKEYEKGTFGLRTTIRHLEAQQDDSLIRNMLSLPVYSKEVS